MTDEKDENEIEGFIEKSCVACGAAVWLDPDDPEVQADPYFCDDRPCEQSAFHYHTGAF